LTREKESEADGGTTSAWSGAQILRLDRRIRRVVLVSRAGEVLGVESRGLAPVLATSDELQLSNMGALIAAVLSALATVTRYFGESLYIVNAFQDYKMLILGPFDSGRILALVIPRSVNGDTIYRKVITFIRARPARAT